MPFFDSNPSTTQEGREREAEDESPIVEEMINSFKESRFITIPTSKIIILEIFMTTFLLFLSLILTIFVSEETVCFYTKYLHIGFWWVALVLDHSKQYYQNWTKSLGYLRFQEQTKNLHHIYFITASLGISALLLIEINTSYFCPNSHTCPQESHITCFHYVIVIIVLELFFLLPYQYKYLSFTTKFNSSHASPDIQKDDLTSSFLRPLMPEVDIGVREDHYCEELLERQADLIKYMKQHNDHLALRIAAINQNLKP